MKILVVDDEPDLVILVDRILTRRGHEVIGAHSGLEALELLKDHSPDLILLDVMMPRIDGWETLRRIREMKGRGRVPISMLTAKNLSDEALSSDDVGELVDYIQKPISKDSLTLDVESIFTNLAEIADVKNRIRTGIGEEEAERYEIAARREWLHRGLLSKLEALVKKTPHPDEASRLLDAIETEQDLIAQLSSERQEIESLIHR